MPKSAKKRKAADFSKAKLKLGKGKQLPSNAIDTSFKARSIALPSQSITAQRDDAVPTTKRRQTYDDLLSHCKHYNPISRRDAIFGLRELLEPNPELIIPSLHTLLSACVRLISDEDASVRKALLSFFTWLLPQVPSEYLLPHSSLLLLFTTSAQTHIFAEIRIDAVRFLDLYLDVLSPIVVSGWNEDGDAHGSRVLEGYLSILNAGTKFGGNEGPLKATSIASVVLSTASKLIVLRSLCNFLKEAIALNDSHQQRENRIPIWQFSSTFSTSDAFLSFERMLDPTLPASAVDKRLWKDTVNADELDEALIQHPSFYQFIGVQNTWSLAELSGDDAFSGSIPGIDDTLGYPKFIARLAHTLHGTLLANFLDCAPQVFSPSESPNETDMQLVLVVVKITRLLYGTLFKQLQSRALPLDDQVFGLAVEELGAFVGYMAPYFPLGTKSITTDIKLEQAYQDVNIAFCELTSSLIPHSTSFSNRSRGKARATSLNTTIPSKLSGASEHRARYVRDYVTALLKGEPLGGQMSRPISSSTYHALLPTLWVLLNDGSSANEGSNSNIVFQSVIQHAIRVSSTSAVKSSTLEFMARLILLGTTLQTSHTFTIPKNGETAALSQEWIKSLPKTLWELGSKDILSTEIILRFLLRALQRRVYLLNSDTRHALCSRLAPYFLINHPSRGTILGPFSRLPSNHPTQFLVLDVAVMLINEEDAGNDLRTAIDSAAKTHPYWEGLNRMRL